MHILVAVLLALSLFVPSLGGILPSNTSGPIDDTARSEQAVPSFDDRDEDSAMDENRSRPDRMGEGMKEQKSPNNDVERNSSDADNQSSNQDTSNGAKQNGDSAETK